jgi:hypothetical protein
MDIRLVFGASDLMSAVAFGLITKLYLVPRLRRLPRSDALLPLVVPTHPGSSGSASWCPTRLRRHQLQCARGDWVPLPERRLPRFLDGSFSSGPGGLGNPNSLTSW